MKHDVSCTGKCNCHGKCGGKQCGGYAKPDTSTRRGRKRSLHEIQKVSKQPSSKIFLETKKQSVNIGVVNILEYAIVCSIILFLEMTNMIAQICDTKKYYDEVVKLIGIYDIPLPLNNRSIEDLQKAVKKAFAVRKAIS